MTAHQKTLESPDGLAGQSVGAAHGSAATWILCWNVKGWVNGHYEEYDDLATALAQLQNIADDETLEIKLRRAGQVPPNDPSSGTPGQ